MVERGLTTTAFEMLIGRRDISDCGCGCSVGVVVVTVGGGEGGAPITLFSATMQSSPMTIGPSKEYILARGWITVDAPMVIWCVP